MHVTCFVPRLCTEAESCNYGCRWHLHPRGSQKLRSFPSPTSSTCKCSSWPLLTPMKLTVAYDWLLSKRNGTCVQVLDSVPASSTSHYQWLQLKSWRFIGIRNHQWTGVYHSFSFSISARICGTQCPRFSRILKQPQI